MIGADDGIEETDLQRSEEILPLSTVMAVVLQRTAIFTQGHVQRETLCSEALVGSCRNSVRDERRTSSHWRHRHGHCREPELLAESLTNFARR